MGRLQQGSIFKPFLFLFLFLYFSILTKSTKDITPAKIGVLIEKTTGKTAVASIQAAEYVRSMTNFTRTNNVAMDIIHIETNDSSTAEREVNRFIQDNAQLIVSFLSCWTLSHMPANLQDSQTAHVAIATERCPQHKAKANPTEKSTDKIMALASVIKYIGWKEANLFIEKSSSESWLRRLVEELSPSLIKTAVYRLDGRLADFSEHIHKRLINLTRSGHAMKHFVVILKEQNARRLLKEAASLYMLLGKILWVIVSDDITAEDTVSLGANARNAHIVILKKACDRRAAADLSAVNLTSALESVTANADVHKAAFTFTCAYWKAMQQNTNSQLHVSCLQMSNTSTDMVNNVLARVFTSDAVSAAHCYSGYKLITLHQSSHSDSTLVAQWHPNSNLTVTDEIFPNFKYGLGNITFVVTTTQLIPYAIKKQGANGSEFEGLCVHILDEMCKKMNFSYVWREPPDGQFGYLKPDGNWSGMVGLAARREVDLGIGPFTLTPSRETVIDFTSPYSEEGRGIIIKLPAEESSDIFKVFRAFSISAWVAFVSSIFLTGLTLSVINGVTSLCLDSWKSETILGRFAFLENTWTLYTFYMEQGGAMEPRTVSGRLVVGFWWLYTIIITTCYTANLAAFFTVSVPGPSIESLEDLANQDKILPVTLYGSQMYRQYQISDYHVHQKIFAAFQKAPIVTDGIESVKIVKTGDYAFITLYSEAKTLASRYCGSITVAGKPFDVMRLGFVTPEGSALNQEFSLHMRTMLEAGLIDRWRRKWWSMNSTCTQSLSKTSATGLTITSLGGPYLVYLGFVVLSMFSLLLERLCHNKHKGIEEDSSKSPTKSVTY